MFKVHRMKVCLDVTESQRVQYVRCQAIITQFAPIFTDLTPEVTMRTIHHHQEWDHGHPWVQRPSTRLINDLFPAPASSNARNYTEWATQTTFINVEFFNSIFLRCVLDDLWFVSGPLSPVASLPRCCLIRCHPSPDDTGWQLDMITNNLPEQSGLAWPRASHEISKTNF